MKEAFGDFEEIKDEHGQPENTEQEVQARVRLPRRGEIIGMVSQRLGGNRMEVLSNDGKTRNCRVPGRFKRKFWLRTGDFVLITPWEFDDTKADIVYHYRGNEAFQIKKKGLVSNLKKDF